MCLRASPERNEDWRCIGEVRLKVSDYSFLARSVWYWEKLDIELSAVREAGRPSLFASLVCYLECFILCGLVLNGFCHRVFQSGLSRCCFLVKKKRSLICVLKSLRKVDI